MAGRHAALTSTGQELTIRDLETPGGTFVNQQRLLAGQTRRLVTGDVIQLGSVQVRVKQTVAAPSAAPVAAPPKAAAAAAKAAASVVPVAARRNRRRRTRNLWLRRQNRSCAAVPDSPAIPGPAHDAVLAGRGAQCRTWDDFLVLAAQSWPALRDELTSGRLADYLRRIHRPDLVPLAGTSRSPDDQLDDWLARRAGDRIERSRAGRSSRDAASCGRRRGVGSRTQTLRITNVGYRLLRCTARVEPPGTRWAAASARA